MKLDAPATSRNFSPIHDLLIERNLLCPGVRILEIASGTGQHAYAFLSRYPELLWQTSEPKLEGVLSIQAYLKELQTKSTKNNHYGAKLNLLEPIHADIKGLMTRLKSNYDLIFTSNLLHISEASTTPNFFTLASQVASPQGKCFIYGPFNRKGQYTSESNARFDQEFLKAQNDEWGLRDIDWVREHAQNIGWLLEDAIDMPANNFALIFKRAVSM